MLFGGFIGITSAISNNNYEVKIISENIIGDTATVVVEGSQLPIELIKEGAEWRVNFGISDMLKNFNF